MCRYAVAVHIAAPVLSGRVLTAGGKAEVLGVLHAVADARYHHAKRSHAAAAAAVDPDFFSISADLATIALVGAVQAECSLTHSAWSGYVYVLFDVLFDSKEYVKQTR